MRLLSLAVPLCQFRIRGYVHDLFMSKLGEIGARVCRASSAFCARGRGVDGKEQGHRGGFLYDGTHRPERRRRAAILESRLHTTQRRYAVRHEEFHGSFQSRICEEASQRLQA